jgi:hypothetical protein
MKLKKEYIVLAVVIFSLAGYLFVKKTNRLHYTLPATPAIAKNSIMKLELQRGDQQTILTRKNGAWFISPRDYPADTAKMDRIIEAITDLTINTLVSESGDYLRYDLTNDKKITVKVLGEKGPLFSFAVGKRATTFKHTFVTIEDDGRVFQAQGNFRNDFDQSPQDLRDRNVLPFAKETLTSLEITDGGKILHLKKKPPEQKGVGLKKKADDSQVTIADGWVDGTGKEVSEAAMNELFSQLTGLQCESYLEEKKKEDFKDPIISIALQGEKSGTLAIFSKTDQKDTGNPAISSGNDYPFVLQKFKVELIRKAVKEIRAEKNEPQAGPTSIPKDMEQKK